MRHGQRTKLILGMCRSLQTEITITQNILTSISLNSFAATMAVTF
jgi:hypothetical protein